MKNYSIKDNHIEIEGGKPSSCKKLTMTRLGAILGINKWQTPFEAWCEITKIYKKPFEESKETLAGKTIEPIVRNYLKSDIYGSDNILSPEDYYGNSFNDIYRKKDFYQNENIFGGMWDTVLTKPNKKDIKRIFEQKTTKRSEDWISDTPMYYLVQGLGYCYMSNVKELTMVATFLQEEDYYHPENFKPSNDNTILKDYNIEDKNVLLPNGNYYTIKECFALAEEWWNKYVETGISPDFDKKKDAEVLKELTHETIDKDDNEALAYLVKEYAELNDEIIEKNKHLKELKETITNVMKVQFDSNPDLKKVEMGRASLSKSISTRLDTNKIKEDGLYEKYAITSETYRLTIKKEGE